MFFSVSRNFPMHVLFIVDPSRKMDTIGRGHRLLLVLC